MFLLTSASGPDVCIVELCEAKTPNVSASTVVLLDTQGSIFMSDSKSVKLKGLVIVDKKQEGFFILK